LNSEKCSLLLSLQTSAYNKNCRPGIKGDDMKNYLKYLSTLLFLLFFISCIPSKGQNNTDPLSIQTKFSLQAEVIKIDNDLITIQVEKPDMFQKDAKLAFKLAQGIIDKSYFLEEKQTRIGNEKVKILRVLGDTLLVRVLTGNHRFIQGQRADIYLEKKMIAIKDFQVIRGRDKEISKYIQEDITTALVNSGQFNVLERLKLETVMNELKLSQTGIMDSRQAKKIGKLLGADLILTGTFADMGKSWNANLRLINTETGLIISAINKSGALNELKTSAYRERGNISGSFDNENADLPGWIVGQHFRKRVGKDGYTKIYIDNKQAAQSTSGSLAMDFRLGTERIIHERPILADLTNLMKRDLYQYNGIEFYIKGSKEWTVIFQLSEKPDNESKEESWFRTIIATPKWKKEKIAFNTMSLNKKKAKRLNTNQIFNLDAIESTSWLIIEKQTPRGSEGTIWIDEVSFY
jgi:TolB-like protein